MFNPCNSYYQFLTDFRCPFAFTHNSVCCQCSFSTRTNTTFCLGTLSNLHLPFPYTLDDGNDGASGVEEEEEEEGGKEGKGGEGASERIFASHPRRRHRSRSAAPPEEREVELHESTR